MGTSIKDGARCPACGKRYEKDNLGVRCNGAGHLIFMSYEFINKPVYYWQNVGGKWELIEQKQNTQTKLF